MNEDMEGLADPQLSSMSRNWFEWRHTALFESFAPTQVAHLDNSLNRLRILIFAPFSASPRVGPREGDWQANPHREFNGGSVRYRSREVPWHIWLPRRKSRRYRDEQIHLHWHKILVWVTSRRRVAVYARALCWNIMRLLESQLERSMRKYKLFRSKKSSLRHRGHNRRIVCFQSFMINSMSEAD